MLTVESLAPDNGSTPQAINSRPMANAGEQGWDMDWGGRRLIDGEVQAANYQEYQVLAASPSLFIDPSDVFFATS
ncbi:MAG: hypothetical protein ABL974_09095 [Prosthecobacter sp.]